MRPRMANGRSSLPVLCSDGGSLFGPARLRLLVETDIETGLRWGELTELRVSDMDLITRVLTISRTVVQVDPKFHPTGERFLVKEYPKDKEYRRLKLSPQLTAKLAAHTK